MMPLRYAAVPESVTTGATFHIGARAFTVRVTQQGQRVWIGADARFVEVVLLVTDDGRYVAAPWLEQAAPRAMRELIRAGLVVPPDPFTMLDEPTQDDDADDAALRVAVIEGLLETQQVSLDDAWPALRRWRALRDSGVPR